jgi:hypothetical protein
MGSANVPHTKKLFWMHPMELQDDEAQVESCFGPFEDCANLDASTCMVYAEHTIGSKIILDAPDGTLR